MLTVTPFVVFPRSSRGACWPPRLKALFLDIEPNGSALHDRVCRLCARSMLPVDQVADRGSRISCGFRRGGRRRRWTGLGR
jgi:hypothetical protein